MQKVYVTEEEKEKILEKLNRDVEVNSSCSVSFGLVEVGFVTVRFLKMWHGLVVWFV